MAAELGWSDERRNAEVTALASCFKTRQAA
jgi:hypothetical protein